MWIHVKGFALTHLSTLEAMLEGGDAVLRAPKEKRSCKEGDAGNLKGRGKGLSPTDNSARMSIIHLGL